MEIDYYLIKQVTHRTKEITMIRYKTSSSKDSFHIVLSDAMPYMQTFWSQNNAIDLTAVLKTYKTLLGAQKSVTSGYVIVWEKGMN